MFIVKLLRNNTISNLKNRYTNTITPKLSTLYRNYNDVAFEDIPEVSPALIKRVLKQNHLGFQEGYTCFVTQCPVCNKNAQSKIYINKTTGLFMCTFCKKTGTWDAFEVHLSQKRKMEALPVSSTNELDQLKESLKDVIGSTSALKLLPQETLASVLTTFNYPVISNSAFENLDVRINQTQSLIYFPLENSESELVGFRCIAKNLNQPDQLLPNLTYGGLLTAKMPKNKDTAVLVPNISDFLVLLNSKINGNIICLPNGYKNLSQYFLPSLERFKKIVLWFGNDVKSWENAKMFAKKLGEKRCYFIRPNENLQLPHLDVDQDFKSIISGAQAVWHKSIITFATLRADVLSDLQNIDKVQGVKWKRYPTLNKILKGHRRGELTVITGPTGSGKTTFISEYSLDLAMQGVNTLWGSFEIRNARLARTMLQQLALVPLDENLHLFDKFADQFETMPVYFMTFHGQQTIKVVMEAVEHATYVHDIEHVIIDNVQFMMGITEEQRHMDRFWKQDAIIAAFRSFATRQNCHVTLVIHPRKEREDEDLTTSSIFGGAKASQEADNVLIIQDKRLTSVRGKKYLQVAKNRYSGDLGIMALDFDKASLSYSHKRSKKDETKPVSSEENFN